MNSIQKTIPLKMANCKEHFCARGHFSALQNLLHIYLLKKVCTLYLMKRLLHFKVIQWLSFLKLWKQKSESQNVITWFVETWKTLIMLFCEKWPMCWINAEINIYNIYCRKCLRLFFSFLHVSNGFKVRNCLF